MELKNFFAQDDQGNLLGGATCYLYVRGTENLAAGLQAPNGTALANPFTADAKGLIQFAAPNGLYDLRVVSGARDYRVRVQCVDVEDSVAEAEAAAGRAEVARDAALIQAGVYVDEPSGRAAVADGQAFKVQGSGEVAAYEYRRVNASSSTLIATYPSKEAYDGILAPHKNLFNKATVIADKYASNLDGLIYDNTAYYTSDLIPITAGSTYSMSGVIAGGVIVRFTCYYNANKQFVAGGANNDIRNFTAPPEAAYIRITIYKGALDTFQVELGSQATSYSQYILTIKPPLGIGSISSDNLKAGSVTNEKLASDAVLPRNTTFFEIGKNLFDKMAVVTGYYLGNDGLLVQSASYSVSDYIQVSAGSVYALSHAYGFGVRFTCYYDENMKFVAGGKSSATDGAITSVTVPAGVAYVRATLYVDSVDEFQFELGSSPTAHVPYGHIKHEYMPKTKTDDVEDGAITLEKTAFVTQGKNLFNKAAVVSDKYVSNIDGILYDNAAYYTSDFIPVTAGVTYAMSYSSANGVRFTCYYNASKQFVAGGANTNIGSFSAPAGTAYVRVTIYKDALNTFQLELGSQPTSYQQFGAKIDPGVLPWDMAAPEIIIPPYIFGVHGRECNVYLDNLHIADSQEYFHDVISASGTGQHQNERWTWTPSGLLTSGAVTVAVHDKRTGNLLTSVTAQQRAADSTAGSGMNKKVLVIGDSLIGAGVITQTLIDIAGSDVMGVTLLGTLGTAPNKHEGRGGWSISTYTTNYAGNPFWINGAVNFPQYLVNNSIATPDWVMIHLGINDSFAQTSDSACSALAEAELVKLDTLIASIKAADANTKVGLMIPVPPSAHQDAFGSSYGTGQTRWRFKRNILIWARQMIAKYAGQEASRIYLVPSNTALDTVNNVSRAASVPVNSRSSVTVERQNNGVHPSASGYQQIGDALWAFLKCNV
ncbi:MAG: SGNH/GDSL hydrolase family protein [Pseudomonas sp.]|nr:SGNH/GDSL hydrolase family protein [Pseudomonas sp.]